jgi:hypothetical protein
LVRHEFIEFEYGVSAEIIIIYLIGLGLGGNFGVWVFLAAVGF